MSESSYLKNLEYVVPPEKPVLSGEKREEYVQIWEQKLSERPGYGSVHEFIQSIEDGANASKREQGARDLVRACFEKPELLKSILEECLRLIEMEEDERRKHSSMLAFEAIKKELHKAGRIISLDTERDEHVRAVIAWVGVYVRNDGLREYIKPLLSSFFHQQRNEEGVFRFVKNIHALAHAIYHEDVDPDVRTELLRILSFQTDVLPASEEFCDLYVSGNFSLDPFVAQLYADLDVAITQALVMYDESGQLLGQHNAGIRQFAQAVPQNKSSAFQSMSIKASRDTVFGPVLAEYLQLVRSVNSDKDIPESTQKKLEKNPLFQRMSNPSTATFLRKKFLEVHGEYEAKKRGMHGTYLYLPDIGIISALFSSRKYAIEKIRTSAEKSEETVVDGDPAMRTIAYLCEGVSVDDIDRPDVIERMRARVAELAHALKYEVRHLVSPRGDLLRFSPETDLHIDTGISEILFKPDSSVIDLVVTVRVGNMSVQMRLEEMSLIKTLDRKPVKLSSTQRIALETVIFTALHGLLNQTAGEVSGADVSRDASGKDRTVTIRRPHMRRLPVGKKFTAEQAGMALKEYGVDLYGFNVARRGEENDPYFTFVSPALADFKTVQKMSPVETLWSGDLFRSKI